jgi:hypothetical protein
MSAVPWSMQASALKFGEQDAPTMIRSSAVAKQSWKAMNCSSQSVKFISKAPMQVSFSTQDKTEVQPSGAMSSMLWS